MLNQYYKFMDYADLKVDQVKDSWAYSLYLFVTKLQDYWQRYTILCFFLLFFLAAFLITAYMLNSKINKNRRNYGD